MSIEEIDKLVYSKTIELVGIPSAQWEVTVLVTNEGYEILAY